MQSPSGRSSRRTAVAGCVAVLALVAACAGPVPAIGPSPTGTAAPSARPSPAAPSPSPSAAQPSGSAGASSGPSASPDLASLYRSIEDQVIAIRGLPATQRLTPTILDEAGLRTRITAQFQKKNPPARIAASELTLKALGLLPQDASLLQLNLDLLSSQVAGYYDADAKALFVVSRSGAIGAAEKVTFAHEFDHALQDQNFGLKGLGIAQLGQGDRSLARLSLAEGDATLLMALWAIPNLSQAEMADLLKVDPAGQATLDRMPAIIHETLLFPYTSGLAIVQGAYLKGGWAAVNAMYKRPPDTTEQLLHPDKYASSEAAIPVALDGPALAGRMGSGWSVAETDTLGEFQLRTWLAARGLAASTTTAGQPSATDAAAGWGGDRYATLRGASGAWAVVLLTAWDTPQDATEFAAGSAVAVRGLAGATAVVAPATDRLRVAVVVASDAATLTQARHAAGL